MLHALLPWLFGLSLGITWLLPLTESGAICSLLSILLLTTLTISRSTTPLSTFVQQHFIGGAVGISLGFYWIGHTISYFGGFTTVPTILLFLLFVLGSSIQFVVYALLYRALTRHLSGLTLATGTAWVLAEYLTPRIFPWEMGHPQIAFLELAQLAAIGGVPLITLLLFALAESIVQAVLLGRRTLATALPFAALCGAVLYGRGILTAPDPRNTPMLTVQLVQANISIEEKHNFRYIVANRERYYELTEHHLRPNSLVVWPESVITEFIPTGVRHIQDERRLPRFHTPAMAIVGGLSYTTPTVFHNSAFGIRSDGSVNPPYHKRILMPFGEYTPFGDLLPWIRDLNATAGDFTRGEQQTLFTFEHKRADGSIGTIQAAPLICYEDIVPELSRSATQQGADILVNLTNDAWFGRSPARLQHHQLSAFRAIESRRPLLRSTNTGYTAIVNHLGQTIAELAPDSEGVLTGTVALPSIESFSTRYGLWWLWGLFGLSLLAFLRQR